MADQGKVKKEKKGLPFIAKILIIAISLILVVVISVGSAFFIASKMGKSSGDETNTVEKTKTEKKGEVSSTEYGTIVEFGEYTVNLRETDPRYLVVKINFELSPEITVKELPAVQLNIEEKKVIIQDRALAILRNKSIADLTADTDFVKLRKEITDEVNKVLGAESVKTIRFNNWLIQ